MEKFPLSLNGLGHYWCRSLFCEAESSKLTEAVTTLIVLLVLTSRLGFDTSWFSLFHRRTLTNITVNKTTTYFFYIFNFTFTIYYSLKGEGEIMLYSSTEQKLGTWKLKFCRPVSACAEAKVSMHIILWSAESIGWRMNAISEKRINFHVEITFKKTECCSNRNCLKDLSDLQLKYVQKFCSENDVVDTYMYNVRCWTMFVHLIFTFLYTLCGASPVLTMVYLGSLQRFISLHNKDDVQNKFIA